MIQWMLAIWFLVLLPFLKPANVWKFMVHILLKPGLENFEHYFTSMWDECNCMVVWAFFGIAFLWDWIVDQLVKESTCNSGDPGSIPGLGRFPGEGNGHPLQYSCLENPVDRGALQSAVHGVTRVGHDLATKPPPPPPVFLPGESHGQRSLMGYSTWSRKELDVTECLIL